jgi:CO dehydrogenase/acetyl-CoA synthase gamma subunit (corrinoid Fe-S protein)
VLSGSFTERGQAARELDIQARRITGLAKARYVAAYVRILIKSGTPVLLAGWHRDVYDVWLDELAEFNPVMYTGSETSTGARRSTNKS